VLGVFVVLAVIGGVVAVLLLRDSDDAVAEEIFLEPAAAPGPDAFTESIPVDPVDPEAMVVPPRAQSTSGTVSQYGSEPGLYGGTQDNARCDRTQLVTFLEANPDKARAWVEALNSDSTLEWSGGTTVSVTQISAYVDELTPITLVSDTRVTNYGYVNGRPTPRQAVLQAGTAVLVDKWGVPRTKCNCGNPLTSPTAVRASYTGTRWSSFDPQTVIVVQQSVTIIDNFTLINIYTGEPFSRPAGTTGGSDGPATIEPVPPTSASTATTGSTSTTSAPDDVITAGDYCGAFAQWIAYFESTEADSLSDEEAFAIIGQALDELTGLSPPEVRNDWEVLRNALTPENFDVISPEVEAANNAITAHALTSCGLDLDN
jgi:hypothetical protein